jgi:hypothetical protein
MRKSLKLGLTITFAVFLIFLIIVQYVSNNINFLMPLMFFSNHETIKSYALEKILIISTKEDIVPKIIKEFEDGNHVELNSIYLILLGVIGDKRALPTLSSAYVRCQDNSNISKCITIQYGSITAMGLIGDENYFPFINTILINYDTHHTQVRRQIYARSLYFITGKQVEYINDDGAKRRFDLWESIVTARKIIEATQTRKRTVDEMSALYKSVF